MNGFDELIERAKALNKRVNAHVDNIDIQLE